MDFGAVMAMFFEITLFFLVHPVYLTVGWCLGVSALSFSLVPGAVSVAPSGPVTLGTLGAGGGGVVAAVSQVAQPELPPVVCRYSVPRPQHAHPWRHHNVHPFIFQYSKIDC